MHLLAERFGFWGDDRGFLKEGVMNGTNFAPEYVSKFSVFTSIVYVQEKKKH